jgi:hypothetical protein
MDDRSLCQELGERGRAYVLNYHSLDKIGAFFDTLYREMYPAPPLDHSRAGKIVGS